MLKLFFNGLAFGFTVDNIKAWSIFNKKIGNNRFERNLRNTESYIKDVLKSVEFKEVSRILDKYVRELQVVDYSRYETWYPFFPSPFTFIPGVRRVSKRSKTPRASLPSDPPVRFWNIQLSS